MRTSSRLLRGLCLTLLCAASGAWAEANPTEDEQFAAHQQLERERIRNERAAVQADFKAREQACRQRFFVNSCLRELQAEERQQMARLRREEVRLGEEERQRAKAAALQRIEERQQEAQRPPAVDPALRQQQAAERERAQVEREADARERVQRQQAREQEAAERRQSRQEAARKRALPPPAPADGLR